MRWRWSTWALVLWSALAAVLAAGAALSTADSCTRSGFGNSCPVYTGMSIAIVVTIWLMVAGVLWILRHGASVRARRRGR